jgi:hypothetical protein
MAQKTQINHNCMFEKKQPRLETVQEHMGMPYTQIPSAGSKIYESIPVVKPISKSKGKVRAFKKESIVG